MTLVEFLSGWQALMLLVIAWCQWQEWKRERARERYEASVWQAGMLAKLAEFEDNGDGTFTVPKPRPLQAPRPTQTGWGSPGPGRDGGPGGADPPK